jgi:hypothetical protein
MRTILNLFNAESKADDFVTTGEANNETQPTFPYALEGRQELLCEHQ